MKAVLFATSPGTDIPCDLAFKNNYAATAAPGVNDDASAGYQVGSEWIYGTAIYKCVDATAGAASWQLQEGGSDAQGVIAAPAATTATGNGSNASLTGGAGGETSGSGGSASLVGGAASGGNSNGGSAIMRGGAKAGTGIKGGSRVLDAIMVTQGAPAAKTVSATLTGAEVASGIITVNQGAGASSALQMPTGTALQAALPADMAIGEAFDFSVINTSTVDAEDATLTVNDDVTFIGSVDIPAHSAVNVPSSARFRARKTADHVFVVYRLS